MKIMRYEVSGMRLKYHEDKYLGYWYTSHDYVRYHTFGFWFFNIEWHRK